MLAVLFAASVSFHVPAAAPRVASTVHTSLALRGGAAPAMGLAHIAAGVHFAHFALYGTALCFKPAMVMKTVMRSDAPPLEFASFPFAVVQYLGAVYLSQALRMVRALTTASMLKTDLLGVGIIQTCLFLVSLMRLALGAPQDSVTLTLPVGQGLLAALAFVGAARA